MDYSAEDFLSLFQSDLSALENFSILWNESQAECPLVSEMPFLLDESIRQSAEMAGFLPEEIDMLCEAGRRIRAEDALARLVWHAYWRIFLSPEPCGIQNWPEPAALKELRGIPYLLVGLGFVPLMARNCESRGIPEAVIRDTASQIRHYCMDNYCRGNEGRLGVYQGQLNWLRNYTREPYVRLGRFEFWLEPLLRDFHVFQNIRTGQLLSFLEPGLPFLENGTYPVDGTAGKRCFLSAFEVDDAGIRGTPCTQEGNVSSEVVFLPAEEWRPRLQKGDFCLSMHIPSGGGMTPDACSDSLRRAKRFFAEYFPETPAKAVVCESWIFNTQLQEILEPQANLCQFQKMVHLMPFPCHEGDGLFFLFLKEWPFSLREAPRKTSLQRKVLEFIEKGNHWRVGQMFLLREEIEDR